MLSKCWSRPPWGEGLAITRVNREVVSGVLARTGRRVVDGLKPPTLAVVFVVHETVDRVQRGTEDAVLHDRLLDLLTRALEGPWDEVDVELLGGVGSSTVLDRCPSRLLEQIRMTNHI